jgi:hypothetical protein
MLGPKWTGRFHGRRWVSPTSSTPTSPAAAPSSSRLERRAISEPYRKPGFVDFSGCDGEHCRHCFIHVGLAFGPLAVVEIDEQYEARPCCAFVAVGQRMVPRNPTGKDGRLVEDVRIEVGIAEAGLRRVKGGVGQIDPARFDQRGGRDAGDVFGEVPELSEAERKSLRGETLESGGEALDVVGRKGAREADDAEVNAFAVVAVGEVDEFFDAEGWTEQERRNGDL